MTWPEDLTSAPAPPPLATKKRNCIRFSPKEVYTAASHIHALLANTSNVLVLHVNCTYPCAHDCGAVTAGGHKKVAQPGSVIALANSPGKKMSTTPPGKDKLVAAGRATSASVLSPRKLADGREASKKDISGSRKSVSEGSSMNGSTASEVMGSNAEQLTAKKSSPLRASVDGKIGKSSPRLNTKPKSDPAPTKAPTNSNGEFTAVDQSSVEAEAKVADYKFSPGASLYGKKSSPRTSSKSKSSSLTSSTGRRFTKNRQETPSPPQPGKPNTHHILYQYPL
jgi:hypothetical protein